MVVQARDTHHGRTSGQPLGFGFSASNRAPKFSANIVLDLNIGVLSSKYRSSSLVVLNMTMHGTNAVSAGLEQHVAVSGHATSSVSSLQSDGATTSPVDSAAEASSACYPTELDGEKWYEDSTSRLFPNVDTSYPFIHSSRSSLSLEAYGRHSNRRLSSWSSNQVEREKHKTQTKSQMPVTTRLGDLRSNLGAKVLLVPKDTEQIGVSGITEVAVNEAYPLTDTDLSEDSVPEGMYAIQKLASRDDAERLHTWQRVAYRLTPLFALFSQILFWTNLVLRSTITLHAQKVSHKIFPLAWIFLGIECSLAVPNLLTQFWQLSALKQRKRPQLRLLGDDVPSIDLFVTCCGEDVSLIMDTARAACDMDYPVYSFRVVILDDAANRDLQREVELDSARRFPNLFYHARKKIPGQPHHFKAGNLNGGLEFVESLPGGSGEFMAALDADMLPSPDLLRALVPHLLLDPKLAMSCPPQCSCALKPV